MSTRRRPTIGCEDLTWLLQYADADVSGMRSTHGAFVTLATVGVSTGHGRAPEMPDHRLVAAERFRKLAPRFRSLDESTKRVLWAAYGPPEHPREVRSDHRRFGHYPGVLFLTKAAIAGHAKDSEKRRASNGRDRDIGDWLRSPTMLDAVRSAMIDEAMAMVKAALSAWTSTAPAEKREASTVVRRDYDAEVPW